MGVVNTYLTKMQSMLFVLPLIGAAAAMGGYHAPAYHAPAPAYHAPAPVYKEEPSPYQYEYGVHDDYHGTNFNAGEVSDAYGNVEGSYSVLLPDGRTQHVTYHADHYGGYVADVTYEGEAHYVETPKYHAPAPAYHAPAPAYHAPAPVYHAAP